MELENTEIILQLPQDIHKLCRICLCVSSNDLLSHENIIFDEFNNLNETAEMIQFCSTIKINPVEGLPMSICEVCYGKLQISYDLITQCKNSDGTLKKILNIEPAQVETNSIPDPTPSSGGSHITQTELDKYQSLTFSKNTLQLQNNEGEDEKDFDQIDLGKFFSTVIQYTKKDSDELSNSEIKKERNEMLNMIENRKKFQIEYTLNEENDSNDFFIKMEDENYGDDFSLSCTNCDSVFSDEETLNNHQSECMIEASEINTDKNTFSEAVAKRRKKSDEFGCDLCLKTFTNASKLALHFYNHAKTFDQIKKDKSLKGNEILIKNCDTAAETFETLESLTEQLNSDENFVCEICSVDFDKEIDLIHHLQEHGLEVIYCNICLSRFDNLSNLKNHKKIHCTDKSKKKCSFKNIFYCPLCQESFGTTKMLQEHSLTHLNEFYKCEKCVRTFNNVVSYNYHVKQHYEPRHLCAICGKSYFTRVTLKTHLRSHTNEKPFKCNVCDKAFRSRSTLSVHKRIHSDFKPYVCSYCGYSCKQSGDLAMHIRTHTGDKPYTCSFPNCGRKFTTCSQRGEHYRRHTNERNHKCIECGKAFLESKTLKVHMLTHSGEKPHQCNTCGKKFRRVHHLSHHMKSHGLTSTSTLTSSKNFKNKEIIEPSLIEISFD